MLPISSGQGAASESTAFLAPSECKGFDEAEGMASAIITVLIYALLSLVKKPLSNVDTAITLVL